jgi:hypothetical protein
MRSMKRCRLRSLVAPAVAAFPGAIRCNTGPNDTPSGPAGSGAAGCGALSLLANMFCALFTRVSDSDVFTTPAPPWNSSDFISEITGDCRESAMSFNCATAAGKVRAGSHVMLFMKVCQRSA